MSANLLNLLSEKKRLWQEFYELTLSQAQFLKPEKTGELLELLDKKNSCIAALDRLEEQIKEARLKVEAYNLSGKDGSVLGALQDEIFQLIEKTAKVDAENQQAIADSFALYKKQVGAFQASKDALLTYKGVTSSGKGFFVDENR